MEITVDRFSIATAAEIVEVTPERLRQYRQQIATAAPLEFKKLKFRNRHKTYTPEQVAAFQGIRSLYLSGMEEAEVIDHLKQKGIPSNETRTNQTTCPDL